jgi:hypothetical protein
MYTIVRAAERLAVCDPSRRVWTRYITQTGVLLMVLFVSRRQFSRAFAFRRIVINPHQVLNDMVVLRGNV